MSAGSFGRIETETQGKIELGNVLSTEQAVDNPVRMMVRHLEKGRPCLLQNPQLPKGKTLFQDGIARAVPDRGALSKERPLPVCRQESPN
jgi:hypothetical protein